MKCLVLLAALLGLSLPLLADDNYSIRVNDSSTGSRINHNRMTLGIPVDVDRKSWDELNEKEKAVWRDYVDLPDAAITPPFPQPSIRALLQRMKLPESTNYDLQPNNVIQNADTQLVVHLDKEGVVESVKLLKAGNLPLAAIYISALMKTRFSPALLNGKAVAATFPVEFRTLIKTN